MCQTRKKHRRVKQEEDFGSLIEWLSVWKIDAKAIDNVHDLARANLSEVNPQLATLALMLGM
jgi:hypothetical protein